MGSLALAAQHSLGLVTFPRLGCSLGRKPGRTTEMSDMEDDFMCDDEEDYDLEYSEDSNSEPNVDLENQYYNSKARKEDDPKGARSSCQKVLELEGEKGEWGFKALKQMIKINFKLT